MAMKTFDMKKTKYGIRIRLKKSFLNECEKEVIW